MTDPGNPVSLVEGLAALIDDESLRMRLGCAARRQAVSRHTWEAHTRRIIERAVELFG
jgi:glycosyltransferase involved in cell wall biosynthesis